jgi:hypothetical protein
LAASLSATRMMIDGAGQTDTTLGNYTGVLTNSARMLSLAVRFNF